MDGEENCMVRIDAKFDTEKSYIGETFDWDKGFRKKSPLNDLFIEWVYMNDLDRNVLTVNQTIHFRLDNLPPYDMWVSALSKEVRGMPWGYTVVHLSICPQHIADLNFPRPLPSGFELMVAHTVTITVMPGLPHSLCPSFLSLYRMAAYISPQRNMDVITAHE